MYRPYVHLNLKVMIFLLGKLPKGKLTRIQAIYSQATRIKCSTI